MSEKEITTVRLPEKFSELLGVALGDLEKVEKSDDYFVDMGTWHEPAGFTFEKEDESAKKCIVCLAGGVMAMSLGVPASQACDPWRLSRSESEVDQRNGKLLNAVNALRTGEIATAFCQAGKGRDFDRSGLPEEVAITPYYRDGEKFKADMRELIERLKQIGE